MAKKVQTYDITKVGPQRFNQLQQQNMMMQGIEPLPDLFPDLQRTHNVTTHNPLQNMQQDVMSPLNNGQGDYWGASRFDEPTATDADFMNLGNIRAENQPAMSKILNGTVKMGTTAATTFLDGTVGALYGIIQGGANLLDKDPDTGFWQGMWDNDFNRAMANIQDAMEKVAPNYYTEAELSNPWYENIFSANFLGDKLLKNAGFTIGAMATMAVPGVGVVGEAANAGVSGLGKLITASKAINNAEKAADLMRGFKQAGGIAQKLVNSFVSANGEAAIESINAVKANEEAINQNIQSWMQRAQADARAEYYRTGNTADYQRRMQEIEEAGAGAMEEAASTMRGLGNSVYFANVGLLMLTNNLEFGKYIKGGWNVQQGIKGLEKKVAGEVVEDMATFGRGIAEGTAALGVPESVGRMSVGRIAAGTFARMGEEGFEEGAQNIISDSGQMQSQAKVNLWAKNKFADDNLLAAEINPDVNEELVSRLKAIGAAWTENFGSGFDASGWEEVFLGALTGGLGTISVHTDPVTKKWNVWQGGFIEEVRKPKEELQQAERIVQAFNDYINNEDFRKNTRHAIAAMTFAQQMDDAVAKNNIMAFKNAELMAVVNDALYFRDMGALDAYKGFYEGMAAQVTDDDVADVKAQMRNLETGKSWFDTKTNDELKTLLSDKAKSTLGKIEDTLGTYDVHSQLYRDKFEELNPALAEAGLRYLTAKAVLIDDLERRKAELEQKQNAANTSRAERGESLGTEIKQVSDKIEQLNKEYEDWVKHPEHMFETIQKTIDLNEKYRIGKDSEQAKERLKTAQTMQEVADFYFSTDANIRQSVFDKATREAEGPVKDLLTSFRPFIATMNSLSNLIDKRAKEYASDLYEEVVRYEAEGDIDQRTLDSTRQMAELQRKDYEFAFKQEVQAVVDSFLEDPEASFSKKTLEQALRERAAGLLIDPELNREGGNQQLITFIASELNTLAHAVKNLDDTYREAEEYQEEVRKKKEEKPVEKPVEKSEETGGKPVEKTPTLSMVKKGSSILEIEEPEEELPEPEEEAPEEEEEVEVERKPHVFKTLDTEGMSDNDADLAEEVLNTDDGSELPEDVSTVTPEFVEEPKETKRSFRGNAFHRFKTSLLASGTAKEEARAGAFYRLMKDKGFDIDYIQNNFLHQLMGLHAQNRLPVQYMLMHGRKRGNADGVIATGANAAHIFLVTEYTNQVAEIVKRTDPQAAGNIIKSDGLEYLVVGVLGYSSSDTALAAQHKKIEDLLRKDDEAYRKAGQNEEFVVHKGYRDNVTNFIYGMTPGYVIRRYEGEDKTKTPVDSDLKTLLETANPKHLNLGNLHWLVLEGRNPKVTARENFRWIKFKTDELRRKPFEAEHPGKLYLYLPAADGTYIPQYVTPVRFRNLSEANGKVWEDIQAAIRELAQAKDVTERKAAMAGLRDLFVFSSNLGGKGTNIFYDEETDTIKYAVADLARKGEQHIIRFTPDEVMTEAPSEQEVFDKVTEMLADTNPRFRMNVRTLSRDPGYYVNNGLIRVNLRSLGTVDARSYVYPINDDGTPLIDFKATGGQNVKTTDFNRVVYFEDQMFRISTEEDGTLVVRDAEENQVTDPAFLRQMTDIMKITNGEIYSTGLTAVGKPDGKHFHYYISEVTDMDDTTFVYVEKGQGSYRRIHGADLATFRSRLRYYNDHRASIQAGEAAVETGSSLDVPVEIPIVHEAETSGSNVLTNGEEVVTKSEEKSVARVAKNANFAREIFADQDSYDRLVGIVNDSLESGETSSLDEVEDILMKGKYAELYAQVSDADSLAEYLDKIEECGI